MNMLIVTNVTENVITVQDIDTLEVFKVAYYNFNEFYKKHENLYRVVYDGKYKTVTDIGIYKLITFESISSRDEYISENGLSVFSDYTEIDSYDYPKLLLNVGHEIYEKPSHKLGDTRENISRVKDSHETEKVKVADKREYVIYAVMDNGAVIYWRGGKEGQPVTFKICDALLLTKKSASSKSWFMSRRGKYDWQIKKAI